MSNQPFQDIQIESSLPKSWEHEQTFNDVLYDWMDRAPWLAISFATHLMMYFLLAAIPWERFQEQQDVVLQASLIRPPEEIFDVPEEELDEEFIELPVEQPEIQETDVVVESEDDRENTDDRPDSPFDATSFNEAIGIGTGAGGETGKIGSRRRERKRVGDSINDALAAGLDWLADHQSPDGSWDPVDYALECDSAPPYATGSGNGVHRVGVTALALLAFLGLGDTLHQGEYRDVIRSGIGWLRSQQNPETGEIGPRSSKEWIYDHAIATLALAEAQYGAPNPLLKRATQKAVNFIARARADYGAWRYDAPSIGEADTSVTGWMIFALAAAADVELQIDRSSFQDALFFIDQVTDGYGSTGYTKLGEGSARLTHLREAFPADATRALTAVGVLSRVFIANAIDKSLADVSGPDPRQSDLVELGVERMLEVLPRWPEDLLPDPGDLELEGKIGADGAESIDFYYWYYGSYALYQLSDRYPKAWRDWEDALEAAILPAQHDSSSPPCFQGSWDPIDPWSEDGGRVYSTALMVLCLEVHFRYGKVLGSR